MIVETSDRRHAVEIDPEHQMFGWVFRRGPDPGQWVSVRQATIEEVRGAMLRAKRLPEATQMSVLLEAVSRMTDEERARLVAAGGGLGTSLRPEAAQADHEERREK